MGFPRTSESSASRASNTFQFQRRRLISISVFGAASGRRLQEKDSGNHFQHGKDDWGRLESRLNI